MSRIVGNGGETAAILFFTLDQDSTNKREKTPNGLSRRCRGKVVFFSPGGLRGTREEEVHRK